MPAKSHSVGTTQQKICDTDSKRTAIIITNTHSSAVIYLNDAPSVSSSEGTPVYPYETLVLSLIEGVNVNGAWHCVSDTASTVVMVNEQYALNPANSNGGGSNGGGGTNKSNSNSNPYGILALATLGLGH